jgi:hypothetical protein
MTEKEADKLRIIADDFNKKATEEKIQAEIAKSEGDKRKAEELFKKTLQRAKLAAISGGKSIIAYILWTKKTFLQMKIIIIITVLFQFINLPE